MQAALSWRQVSPGHKAQDLWEFPGLSQAWSHLASGLSCTVTRTDNTHLLVPLHPQGSGSLSVSRAPAHPSNKGFLLLKGSRTSFVLTQTEIKAWMC